MIDDPIAYAALKSRDARFDGVFFVGVTSTGIYCRPICPARTPKRANCRFFANAGAAEKALFRPCLRCRPELAPGQAPVDKSQRIAYRMVDQIHEGLADDGAGLEEIAAQFEMSSRQLRRIIQKELGVSPIELLQTRRLLLAKQLLTETRLPVTEIAFASGFSSLRRFNDAFRIRYRMAPSRLRHEAAATTPRSNADDTSTLLLTYRPPYDWEAMLEFLKARMIHGVESVTDGCYSRTVRLGSHTGWIRITHAKAKHAVCVEFTHALTPVLPTLLGRLRNLFDLAARPDVITKHLGKDKILKNSVRKHPGLRVPGAFDGFEMMVRAILGQQITVRAATTLACRFAAAFGEKFTTPFPELNRLTPTVRDIADARVDAIARLGIVRVRANSILHLARACASRLLTPDGGTDPEKMIKHLVALPGIGDWTAQYIAMRAFRWPDAFPHGDIALRNRLGGVSARQADEISQAWRPWRSYAVLHLWGGHR